jgi:maltose O-acetyltransferase
MFDSAPVIIEDDVWIGFNATILKGVTIGKGAVIQPGSVVLKDVPAGAVVSGNPAQIEVLDYA